MLRIAGKQAKALGHLSRAAAEIQLACKSPADQLRWRPQYGGSQRDHPISLLLCHGKARSAETACLMTGVAIAVAVTWFCRASLC